MTGATGGRRITFQSNTTLTEGLHLRVLKGMFKLDLDINQLL